MMLKEERQRYIVDKLRAEGKVLASELCNALHVSEDTVRRDLRDLFEVGIIQRVHGGALLRSPIENYAIREQQNTSAKDEIAQAAVQLVRNGQVIIMDGGTTTYRVAHRFPSDLRATIITNSTPIATLLGEYPNVEVILLGGKLYKPSLVTTGVETVEALRMFKADLCMLGICSIHLDIGISIPNLEELHVKKAMITSAAEVAALASSEKIDTAFPYVVGSLKELDYLVTDSSVSDSTLVPYRDLGITILHV